LPIIVPLRDLAVNQRRLSHPRRALRASSNLEDVRASEAWVRLAISRFPLGINRVYLGQRGSLRSKYQTSESAGELSGILQSNKIDAQLYTLRSHTVLEGTWINAVLAQPLADFGNTDREVPLVKNDSHRICHRPLLP